MVRRGVARDPQLERFWRRVMQRQARSGRTVREFCVRERLFESAFYFWRRELQRRDRESAVSEPDTEDGLVDAPAVFVPVEVVPERSAPRLEVVLPSGATLHVPAGFDRQTLAGVVDVLERHAC